MTITVNDSGISKKELEGVDNAMYQYNKNQEFTQSDRSMRDTFIRGLVELKAQVLRHHRHLMRVCYFKLDRKTRGKDKR